jgi:hypothetical protein
MAHGVPPWSVDESWLRFAVRMVRGHLDYSQLTLKVTHGLLSLSSVFNPFRFLALLE